MAIQTQIETFKKLVCKELIGYQTISDNTFFYWNEEIKNYEMISCNTEVFELDCKIELEESQSEIYRYQIDKVSDLVANKIDDYVISNILHKAGLYFTLDNCNINILDSVINGMNIADQHMGKMKNLQTNWICCSDKVANSLLSFSFCVEQYSQMKYHGVRKFGRMLNREIEIYCSSYMPDNKIILGAKGNMYNDCGFFLCAKNLILPNEDGSIFSDLSLEFIDNNYYCCLSLG